ncbi:D-2-hydroxyacid dehydrogenase [Lacihabitans soyangensis]|uniref:D-2-hydroxyacid dehydrogenase n=1 Tax=Lacihabitans soyangensis TaxID=869394 RepID=A0AAE3KUK6_9BACT|nr:D-2-hydroxyacid dehydrogenase [Lacihabitans soyangensis]MCP9763311.1 D-2-hydroxyacid dehydrogenase [Lacihabitans soyangensis]
MKIVFLDSYTIHPQEIDLSVFSSFGKFIHYDRTPPELVWERAKDAEIVLTNKVVLDRLTMQKLPKLKYIGVTATGYNIVDIAAANELGITVTNARNYSSNSVAQQVFAMILSFSNRLAEHASFEKWASQPDFCYYDNSLTELSGKTIGLIGFGNIAQKVAKIALAFEMKVLVNKRTPLDSPIDGITEVDFETLLLSSDYISLHCPLTADNEKFINSAAFLKMKNTAVLINTARGGLINEEDLKIALNSREISGAYLDVLTVEPPAKDHILADVKNCKVSPHIAWASVEARKKLIEIVIENLKGFLEGKPQNVLKP